MVTGSCRLIENVSTGKVGFRQSETHTAFCECSPQPPRGGGILDLKTFDVQKPQLT